jgi:cell division protein FtsX
MKYLVFIFLFGCGVTAQGVSEESKEDQELDNLLKKAQSNIQVQATLQDAASKEQKKIVKQTISQIVGLKEENKELKIELNETKAKFDSLSFDTLVPFQLLPIPR